MYSNVYGNDVFLSARKLMANKEFKKAKMGGYHALFKTTPKSDLIHARIDRAKYLLTNEAIAVAFHFITQGDLILSMLKYGIIVLWLTAGAPYVFKTMLK